MRKKVKLANVTTKVKYNPLHVSIKGYKIKNKTSQIRYITIQWPQSTEKYFHLHDAKIMWKMKGSERIYCGKYVLRETTGSYTIQVLENEEFDLSLLFGFFKNSTLLSIIVPMYNVGEYVIDLLKSFPAENDIYEVIFVDDCSTDDTVDVLRQNINIPNYKIVQNTKNVGLGESRNIGLKNTNSNYVMFLDSDDWLNKGSIDYFLLLIKEYQDTDMFIFNDVKSDEYMEKKVTVSTDRYYIGNNLNLLAYRHMSACVKLYKRGLFDKIHFKKDVTFEDVYLLVDIFKEQGIQVINTQTQVYNYRQRSGSIINSKFTDDTINEYVKLMHYIFKQLEYEYAKFMYYRLCKHIIDRNGELPLEIKKISDMYDVKKCQLYELYTNTDISGNDKANKIKLYFSEKSNKLEEE